MLGRLTKLEIKTDKTSKIPAGYSKEGMIVRFVDYPENPKRLFPKSIFDLQMGDIVFTSEISGDYIKTAPITKLCGAERDWIVFETENSIYKLEELG